MALATLAVAADLTARGIPITDEAGVAAFLASASAAVRDAAGAPISQLTSTVVLWTEASQRIELPSGPVTAVASVTLDGVALTATTDYVLRGSALWRVDEKWQREGDVPSALEVTFTHGYATVPADIVDLVCALAGAGLAAKASGYTTHAGIQYESIDDYRVGYTTGDEAVGSAMEIPERTRRTLRRRFAPDAIVVGSVR